MQLQNEGKANMQSFLELRTCYMVLNYCAKELLQVFACVMIAWDFYASQGQYHCAP